jgi:methionine sulfoxide reductase heme-binding subunit
MTEQIWWYLSRSSGIVAWMLLAASCLWGVLMVTRMLKPADRPAWMLDLHRWLGALSVITTGIHLGALVADNYVHFGWAEIFVPQASEWKTVPVTLGVIAFYFLLLIEASSLMMKKLPRPVWHGIHLTSYLCFVLATAHGVYAGTDRKNLFFIVLGSGAVFILGFATLARYLTGRAKAAARAPRPTVNA